MSKNYNTIRGKQRWEDDREWSGRRKTDPAIGMTYGLVVYGETDPVAGWGSGVGGPRVLAARVFKCFRILRITRSWVMKERIRIREPHLGQVNGSSW